MHRLFNGRLKFLFLAPIALLIAFAFVFQNALDKIEQQMLLEKMVDKKLEVDMIAAFVNNYVRQDNDWGVYDYPADINVLIEEMDKTKGTVAIQCDDQLNIISKWTYIPGHTHINPMLDTNFRELVRNNKGSGQWTLKYKDGQKDSVMLLYFRWLPNDESLANRSLIVVGITKDSIANVHIGLTIGMIVLIATTFLVNTVFVILLCHLGSIYKARNGPKWRAML